VTDRRQTGLLLAPRHRQVSTQMTGSLVSYCAVDDFYVKTENYNKLATNQQINS